jgi:hypothetical protein
VTALGFFFFKRRKRRANGISPVLDKSGGENNNSSYSNGKRGFPGLGNEDNDGDNDHRNHHETSPGIDDSCSQPISHFAPREIMTTTSLITAPGSGSGVITSTPQFRVTATSSACFPTSPHVFVLLPPSSSFPSSRSPQSVPLSPAAIVSQRFSPTEYSRRFGFSYYDKDGFSKSGPPTAPLNAVCSKSPQYTPAGSNGRGNMNGWFDPRSPQFFEPGYGSSPAAWMAMMNNNNSNPQLFDPSRGFNNGGLIKRSFHSPLLSRAAVETADDFGDMKEVEVDDGSI